MQRAICIVASVFLIAGAQHAQALTSTLVRFDIAGTLTDIDGINSAPPDTPTAGSAFSGNYVFDVSHVGTPGTTGFSIYHTPYPAGVISLKVGDWEWRETGEAPMTIIVGDNVRSRGLDSFYVDNSRIERAAPPHQLHEYTLFRWQLNGPPEILDSGQLPRSAFPLEPWTENRWSISMWGSPPAPLLELSGSVTSFKAVALSDFADFNGDGAIDALDLALWKANVGKSSSATLNEGDADGDGDIDGHDFLFWQQQATGAGAVAAAVPETATIVLLSTSALLLAAQLYPLRFWSARSRGG